MTRAQLAKTMGTTPKPVAASQGYEGQISFYNLGAQLQAVHRAAISPHQVDARLQRRGPAGLSEQVPGDGGFAVDSQFVSELLQKTYATGELLSRTTQIPITNPNANALKVPSFDEQSRANGSRFGGATSYWINQADTITASKPKVRLNELPLLKLAGLVYVTDELLQDTGALSSFMQIAFSGEMSFRAEEAIVAGTGAGQPLGITSSPATIVVAKESGQSANTILSANISKIWARMWGPSRSRGLFLVNPEIEGQLHGLTIGAGTSASPMYVPTTDPDSQPFNLLLGRPVIPSEYVAAASSQGDLVFIDPSQILVTEKDGIQASSSLHVKFLTDEMAFKFIWRMNAQSSWHTAITPQNGSTTVSPYVVLGAR